MAKDEAAIARAKDLAQGFIGENFKRAEALEEYKLKMIPELLWEAVQAMDGPETDGEE